MHNKRALQLARHLWHCLEQVSHEAVVGNLEDGRLCILVDGDDHLAVLHACQVLDRAADADGDVQLRGDNLARLPYLQVVRHKAGVDSSTRGANRSAHLVSQVVQKLEVLAVLQAAAARNDNARAGQLGTVALRHLCRDEGGEVGVGGGDGGGSDCGGASGCGGLGGGGG